MDEPGPWASREPSLGSRTWPRLQGSRARLVFAIEMRKSLGVRLLHPRLFSFLLLATSALSLSATGCGGDQGWSPPPPQGPTYAFQYQGFKASGTMGLGMSVETPTFGIGYYSAFEFNDSHELQGQRGTDPLTESTPLDGVRFNQHLGPRGKELKSSSSAAKAPSREAPTPQVAPATSGDAS